VALAPGLEAPGDRVEEPQSALQEFDAIFHRDSR
jgi:hypothetical protein